MGKITRTRRTLIAADMARMLRELQQASSEAASARPKPAQRRSNGRTLVVKGK